MEVSPPRVSGPLGLVFQTLLTHATGLERGSVKTADVTRAREQLRALVKATKAALEHNDK